MIDKEITIIPQMGRIQSLTHLNTCKGPRCADVTFPAKTVTRLHIIPVDASGNNGFREVEVWATSGPQYSNNTCVNQVMVTQTIPQAATTQIEPRSWTRKKLFGCIHVSDQNAPPLQVKQMKQVKQVKQVKQIANNVLKLASMEVPSAILR